MSSLEDQLNEDFAPGWRPEPGDAVMGVVVDVSMRERYEVYRVVTDHPPQVEWGGGASVSPDPPESLNPNGTFAPGYGTLPPGTEAFTPQEPPPANPGAAKDESIPF
jgi:hypothetical protein